MEAPTTEESISTNVSVALIAAYLADQGLYFHAKEVASMIGTSGFERHDGREEDMLAFADEYAGANQHADALCDVAYGDACVELVHGWARVLEGAEELAATVLAFPKR